MSKINYQALREAAKKALPAMQRLLMMPNDELFDEALLNVDGDVDAANAFNLLVGPETILALLDELEADKEKIKTLESRNRRLEGIIDAAEKRIAELAARVVNLPKRSIGEVMHMSGFSREYAEGWCAGNDNARHEIRAAGVKIKEE